jgi:enamine deaminase RidA (YjgF/YER057c/UK114 family)
MNVATVCPPAGPAATPGLIKAVPGSAGRGESVVRLGDVVRLVLLLTPEPRGDLATQIAEVLAARDRALRRQDWRMHLTTQTVFLADAADRAECERRIRTAPNSAESVFHFVVQPPANGARIAVEAWAIGGPDVVVESLSPNAVRVAYDGLQWLHTAGLEAGVAPAVTPAADEVFARNTALLVAAGMDWGHVVRTWWYLGDITEPGQDGQRYQELNRARAEAFRSVRFGHGHAVAKPHVIGYPASTGIGMAAGSGLSLATLALKTNRRDVRLLPLENPLQTPAYDYAACYSPQSPKFSRAMALLLPDYLTLWISGTASIINSEVIYPQSIVAQTEQTLDNIAALISPANFARHGQSRAGATLADLAKVRVYVKRAVDVAACRAVCQRRLGNVPAVFVVADVCRPELLVEIEGVAFAPRAPQP